MHKLKVNTGGSSSLTLHQFFRQTLSKNPWLINFAGWLTSPRDLPVSAFSVPGSQACGTLSGFVCGCQKSDSSKVPMPYARNSLPRATSQPLNILLLFLNNFLQKTSLLAHNTEANVSLFYNDIFLSVYFSIDILFKNQGSQNQGSQTNSFAERLVVQTNPHYTFTKGLTITDTHPGFYYVSAAFITVTSTTAYLDKLHAEQASGLSCLLQTSCCQHRLTVTEMLRDTDPEPSISAPSSTHFSGALVSNSCI